MPRRLDYIRFRVGEDELEIAFVLALELPATTLAQLIGHTDAGFTLRVYTRDARDTATVVDDFLRRAAGAGVGK